MPRPPILRTVARLGLLRLVQHQVALSDCSIPALQRRSGVPNACLRRYLSSTSFREVVTVERVLSTLDLEILASDRDGRWQRLELHQPARCDRRTTPVQRGTPPLPPSTDDTLLATIRALCARRGFNAHALHLAAGIPYASARRLLKVSHLRVATPLLTLLAAMDVSLVAVTPEGDCLTLALGRLDPVLGEGRHARQLATQRARPRPSNSRSLRPRGALVIPVRDLVELYEVRGFTYAEIARRAGVCAERVRQLLRSAGCVGDRARRIEERRAAALSTERPADPGVAKRLTSRAMRRN